MFRDSLVQFLLIASFVLSIIATLVKRPAKSFAVYFRFPNCIGETAPKQI